MWYDRDILGKRKIAEGLCYKYFADHYKEYLTHNPDYDIIVIGVDIGGNGSYHAFVASGIKNNHTKLTALASKRPPAKDTTPKDIVDMLKEFIRFVTNKYGQIAEIRVDSAEQVIKNGIQAEMPNMFVKNSIKNEVMQRVRALNMLVANGRFEYTEDCESLVEAIQSAMMNPKKLEDERLDDGTSDIDSMDAFEYSWEKDIKQYTRL